MPRTLTRLLRLAAAGAVLCSAASAVAGGITIDIGIGTPPQLVVVPGTRSITPRTCPSTISSTRGATTPWRTAPGSPPRSTMDHGP